MVTKKWLAFGWCVVTAACNVSRAAPTTGGVTLGGDGGTCPKALVVASSDYTSTNISVASTEGNVLSESMISSASAPPGLTAALSGDVVLPSAAPLSGKLVLIDRYPNSVITWVDPSTASVLHQLPVATGFAANPHDYLEVGGAKAYVTRYETNPNPGRESNDGGGDVLVIDTDSSRITGRIPLALPTDGAFLPRADRMLRVGEEVWVALQRFDADFKTAGDARIVGVSTANDTVAWTVELAGAASCGDLAIAPSQTRVALSCSGLLDSATLGERSAVVLLDATAHPPVEIERFMIAPELAAPLGLTLTFASETLLVGAALGDTQAHRNDTAYLLDTTTGAVQVVADAGAAFAFGDARCLPGCNDRCFLADAQSNVLRVWKVNGSLLEAQDSLPVDPTIGLPPRSIGAL